MAGAALQVVRCRGTSAPAVRFSAGALLLPRQFVTYQRVLEKNQSLHHQSHRPVSKFTFPRSVLPGLLRTGLPEPNPILSQGLRHRVLGSRLNAALRVVFLTIPLTFLLGLALPLLGDDEAVSGGVTDDATNIESESVALSFPFDLVPLSSSFFGVTLAFGSTSLEEFFSCKTPVLSGFTYTLHQDVPYCRKRRPGRARPVRCCACGNARAATSCPCERCYGCRDPRGSARRKQCREADRCGRSRDEIQLWVACTRIRPAGLTSTHVLAHHN